MDGLQKVYAGQVRFTRVNILDHTSQSLMEKFGFSTSPEIYLTDHQGQILANWDDFVSSSELSAAIDRALKKRSGP